MNSKIQIRLLFVMTVLCMLFFITHAYSQYTINYSWIKPGIPDVNKPDLDPNKPGWQKDNSCGVASTTNMLWAAGYRYKPSYAGGSWSWSSASSAFDLYSSILQTSIFAGFGNPGLNGWSYQQEAGWMRWYFQNNENELNNLYKSITWKEDFNGITLADRNYLINELRRCQYVELGIGDWYYDSEGKLKKWYHSVTMVGYFATTDGYSGTILHDSDRISPSIFSNDYYQDGVCNTNRWALLDYSARVWGYKTLCPIPEPGTFILMIGCIFGFCIIRFQRKTKA